MGLLGWLVVVFFYDKPDFSLFLRKKKKYSFVQTLVQAGEP